MSISQRRALRERKTNLSQTLKKTKAPAYLYHLTASRNKASIINEGLRPSANGFVWLFDSITWAKNHFKKQHVTYETHSKVLILKVKSDKATFKSALLHTWAHEGKILPEAIKPYKIINLYNK
jgi:RNA:NAD 2'-phosphotransferase (TPT1/KptA family)